MAAAKILVKGLVQMVGYRYYTSRHAGKLGVKGYVRNLPSGDVEVVAQADNDTMDVFIELLKQGPRSAVVEAVRIDDGFIPETDFKDFSVRF
ncbi:MAG: acylphosphatase [Elusimicrobiota bacterium]